MNSCSVENPIYESNRRSDTHFNKTRSLVSLKSPIKMASLVPKDLNNADERARSMEFLLDDSDKNAHLLVSRQIIKKIN